MDLEALKQENSRQLREDWREKRETFRSLPEIISLNHSNACNLRCITCWHHTGVPIQGMRPETKRRFTWRKMKVANPKASMYM